MEGSGKISEQWGQVLFQVSPSLWLDAVPRGTGVSGTEPQGPIPLPVTKTLLRESGGREHRKTREQKEGWSTERDGMGGEDGVWAWPTLKEPENQDECHLYPESPGCP